MVRELRAGGRVGCWERDAVRSGASPVEPKRGRTGAPSTISACGRVSHARVAPRGVSSSMAQEHLGTPSHTVPSFHPPFEAPRFSADGTPTRVQDPSLWSGATGATAKSAAVFESRYVMVQSGAPAAVEECE